ncbi:MAG: glycosyltransferase [Blautia sp.]|nr:glycosyltransferase [Lachnoclostridium sp.]MCM1211844.1 glycosyltransferase [Blautia sp.]
MVKVSIIMPIYNEEKYLRECLESVINQSLKDIEIICINDGSTDSTKDIIDEFARKDKRIKAIHKKNTGNGNTMNCGIETAMGEYIGIVEGDDFIEHEMYEKLYALSQNGTVDVVKGNFWDCYDELDGSVTKVVNQERSDLPALSKAESVHQIPGILWGHPSIWSGIYRREFIRKKHIRFKEVKGAGWVDNPFFFDVITAAETIVWTNIPYYNYRKCNQTSSSNGYDLKIPFERMIDNLEILEKNSCMDEVTLKYAYARALMYLVGATKEKHYPKNMDYVRPYMQKMLGKINSDVIEKDFHLYDQRNYFKFQSPLMTLIPFTTKILIYNWVPFDNPNKVGGGVTVYCRNLIEMILRQRPDICVYFLSSGWAYDIGKEECYIRKTDNVFGDRCRSFEIVNSPVPAPQDMLFQNPKIAFENSELKNIFRQFMDEYGPFGTIHFNNLEGLSLDVFSLKREYPECRFVYSLHNYVPVCMTGFYFQRHKRENCNPQHSPQDCGNCINRVNYRNLCTEIIQRAMVNPIDMRHVDIFLWCKKFEFDKLDETQGMEYFTEFAQRATDTLNQYMDVICAVSNRVKEIAVENGFIEEKISVNYIGTKVADMQVRHSIAKVDECLKVAYLGSDLDYVEKGYPFLLEALGALDSAYASNIDLVLTTSNTDRDDELRAQLSQFHSINIIHGYTHDELSRILQGVHIGIVPVLWEDNLPQIAIEMVAMGVPILCSDAGGASELCDSEKFRFIHGDKDDFLKKLMYLIKNKKEIKSYWDFHFGLTNMKRHFDEIKEIYQLPQEPTGTISVNEYARLLDENDFLYRNLGDGRVNAENTIRQIEEKLNIVEKQRDYLQYCLDETRKSKTYKIGRFLTYLPRKIRGDK